MIKAGDIVWVNETTLSGQSLEHEWCGKVVSVKKNIAKVKDTTGGDYNGEVFIRAIDMLEIKE